ncbi:MAG: hypothetical protein ABGY96_06845 [bacterium]
MLDTVDTSVFSVAYNAKIPEFHFSEPEYRGIHGMVYFSRALRTDEGIIPEFS